jgi:hypothetical protein
MTENKDKMNAEIKKTVKAGNSSAVILPKAWLNQEVRVELVKKTPEIILNDVLSISKKYVPSEKIIGVYLTGSYARKEQTPDSDIDMLIISDDVNKREVREGIYSILIVSWGLLKWKLENDLFPIGPMIKEAQALINADYLKHMKEVVKVTRKNVKWYINTTKEKLELVKERLESKGKNIDSRTAYTLVLRIRTLQMIQNLIKNKLYSKKDLIQLIKKVSGSNNAYAAYLAIKNESEEADITTKEEAKKLYDYLEKQLKDTKKLLKY